MYISDGYCCPFQNHLRHHVVMLLIVLDLHHYTIAARLYSRLLYKHSVRPFLTAFFNRSGFLQIDGFKSKSAQESQKKKKKLLFSLYFELEEHEPEELIIHNE